MCAGKRGGGESSGGEAAVNRRGKKSSPHVGGKEKPGPWSWFGRAFTPSSVDVAHPSHPN